MLEIDFKQNKSLKENFDILSDKNFWSPNGPARRAFRSPGRFIGRLGRPGDLLFYTLPLSPLKPRFLALIEQYLPNISDPVYSVHQSFM